MAVRPECPPAPTSAEHALSVSSLHHGRASTHPRSVGPPRRLYNRRCVGGRDTPGHDDLGKILVPQPLILMPMAMPDHNDMAPPVRQRVTAVGIINQILQGHYPAPIRAGGPPSAPIAFRNADSTDTIDDDARGGRSAACRSGVW